MRNLKLTEAEEDDLVAFLKTLTDDYQASHSATAKHSASQSNYPTK
jgi:hypothetical protein